MKDILIGTTKRDKDVHITPKERSTHMHIIGASGKGKSKFIEHLIREDILNNNGLCFIDPHGHLYNDLVRWCTTKRMLGRKKIILFDPSENEWTFGFNPLSCGTTGNIAFFVDAMVNAVAKVWGGEDSDKTPRLKRCLRIIFHALVEKKLTLYEARHLLNANDDQIRLYITRDLQDETIGQEWDYLNSLKSKAFYEEFGSSINRMMEFLSSPVIRTIVGQNEATIDFRKIMDEGWVILVNLSSADRISDDNARLLGTLIINDLLMKAKGRPQNARPFYLYIDECARYINNDTARILDECRKFGLHLILAHQHLAQLRKAGDDVYSAVMTDAQAKVIFGGLMAEDAEILTQELFLGELDLEEAKKSMIKPVVAGYRKIWLEGYAQGRGQSSGSSSGTSRGGGSTSGTSEAITTCLAEGALLENMPTSSNALTSNGTSESWSESDGFFSQSSESESWSSHEAMMPILTEMPGQLFTLQEQIYRAMDRLVNQPVQSAVIKLPGKTSQFVKIPTIEPGFANDTRVQDFKEQCYHLTDFAHSRQETETKIQARQKNLLDMATNKTFDEPESFSEEDNAELVRKEGVNIRDEKFYEDE